MQLDVEKMDVKQIINPEIGQTELGNEEYRTNIA